MGAKNGKSAPRGRLLLKRYVNIQRCDVFKKQKRAKGNRCPRHASSLARHESELQRS